MATLSEIYYRTADTDWSLDGQDGASPLPLSLSSCAFNSSFNTLPSSNLCLAPLRSSNLASLSAFNRRSISFNLWIHLCSPGCTALGSRAILWLCPCSPEAAEAACAACAICCASLAFCCSRTAEEEWWRRRVCIIVRAGLGGFIPLLPLDRVRMW